MGMTVTELEIEALKLDARDRALLAERLIGSLDSEEDSDAGRLWVQEAERRYSAYKDGRVLARPADIVIREAQKKIK